ncbi:unnamed protein product [Didymodactylos carnosus]|uniref:Potassium transporter n=1 Tax=Didymodactylos carnosus TaxID=1234261 RepID=A0A814UZP9_9BILA|nr:unnamed protein product [Didymodactylos carnosus]CAF1181989.1 unnamed protein product [Didymodactylos carnosus]CAF3688037.1 unnamed protein product [Didymodactylos carnosus]CAF3946326.1 unnamed protein product [Didymodactylos carnosus]
MKQAISTVRFADELSVNSTAGETGDSSHVPEPSLKRRRKSGILKKTPNTIDRADAPPIIRSDEGLSRVSPFNNFSLFLSLTIRSFGIIFGDIGTSPLYVIKAVFDDEPTEQQCIGAVSLIVWNLIIVVSIKYTIFILMADNRGEGGPFALCGLLTGESSKLRARAKYFASIVALLAASLVIGDGALTPAVSILSAMEGLTVAQPELKVWTVRITVVIIVFIMLIIIGIWRITFRPVILRAFNPWEALHYLIREKRTGFYQIGSTFLAVTGLEALYADLGHIGRWPIRFSWFTLVFPAVLINYLGQGSLLILDPSTITNPFYYSVPHWARWPVLVFSIVATTIASQAIITGSFSLISQAVALGFSVPFEIIHTSQTIIGHIYVPAVNYFLLILTLAVTIGFQTSDHITDAYGVTVCSVMVLTTILYMMVMRWTWSKPVWLVLLFGIFLVIDGYTLAANVVKVPSGGWVAILIAVVLFLLSFCWFYGNWCLKQFFHGYVQTKSLEELQMRLGVKSISEMSPAPVIDDNNNAEDDDSDTESHIAIIPHQRQVSLDSDLRISSQNSLINQEQLNIMSGLGCFLTNSRKYTPHVFESFLRRTHIIPQTIIFLKIEYARIPVVDDDKRLLVKIYGETIYHITAIFGYSESYINLFNVLKLARILYNVPVPEQESDITFFMSNETIAVLTRGWKSWIRRWPLYIYRLMKSLYPGVSLNIELAPENTIIIGILAEL